MDVYDGYFEVIKREDGYYVDVFPEKEHGKKVELDHIIDQLNQQGIEFDLQKLRVAFLDVDKQPSIKVPLSESNTTKEAEEVERKFALLVSDDRMKLYVKFFPVKNPVIITAAEIIEDAKRIRVTVPIEEELLNELINHIKYNDDHLIATGTPAQEATEAVIEYNFKTEKDYRPEVDKDGNVNYHKLHVFANVSKQQLLATLIPGEEGKSGNDLFGNEVKFKKVRLVKLKRGKNVLINDEGTQLFSDIDGLVKLEDEKVVVNDTFSVAGNVGSSTGDIDFPGSIVINGNVMSGYKVICKGDVEVIGVVEGAIIEAGGNVTLHRGVQGMSNSHIKAGGNVMARYIENAEVISGGMIHSEAILHSNVSAKGDIKVEGKKGMISGGSVRSGTEISANTLGSHMGTATNIEVGIDPLVWEEYNELLKEVPKIKKEAEKLEQVIILLNKKKEIEGDLDEQKKAMYISATRNKIFLTNKINISEKRLVELKEEAEKRNDGKIKCRNTVYPGVRITIGTSKYFVRDELKYVCMIKDGADVKLTSL